MQLEVTKGAVIGVKGKEGSQYPETEGLKGWVLGVLQKEDQYAASLESGENNGEECAILEKRTATGENSLRNKRGVGCRVSLLEKSAYPCTRVGCVKEGGKRGRKPLMLLSEGGYGGERGR